MSAGLYIPADKYAGSKEGYVFMRREVGLGYHLDPRRPDISTGETVSLNIYDFIDRGHDDPNEGAFVDVSGPALGKMMSARICQQWIR